MNILISNLSDMQAWWWAATFLGIIGAILNARKDIIGFIVWIISNIILVIIGIISHNHPLAILFTVYTFISLYGIITWSKK